MPKNYGGGYMGNKSVTGKDPNKGLKKGKSMIGTPGKSGRSKGGRKQPTMLARS